MTSGYIQEFTNDDKTYHRWLDRHSTGYVINTTRNKSPNYMVLHRASCTSIYQYTGIAEPGGFTERDFIKICALDIETLRKWVRQNGRPDGTFTTVCSRCKPM